MANCPEFLFFRQLAIQRFCMDKEHAEMFAQAISGCSSGDDDGGDTGSGGGSGNDTDEKVKVTSNDTNSSYLFNKIVGTGAIDITQINDGGDESLGIGHEDTSSIVNIDTDGSQVIDTLIFDTYGHVIGFTLRDIDITGIFDSVFSVQDTESIDLTFSGGILSADAIISPQESNLLTIFPDGLFAGTLDNLLIQGGGVVTWLQDYDFNVSAATYYLNGIPYTSPTTDITLSPADPDLDRFDVIFVDADGIVKVREGIPDVNPLQPSLDLGLEVGLGVVFVQAGSTQPVDATEECLFQEGAGNWTPTASDASINVASGVTPCSGAVAINGTTVTTGDYFKLVRNLPIVATPDFNVLHFLIKSKGAWGNRQLNIRWYNAGVAIGINVVLKNNTYNFDANNIVNCQLITINLSDFGLTLSQAVDELRFTMSGSNNIGFIIDDICIQNNGVVVFPTDDDIHRQYFGPQPQGQFWIENNGRADGWFTSPQKIGTSDLFYSGSEKFGWGSIADNLATLAMGFLAHANGNSSTAIGNQSFANGSNATAIGQNSISQASGAALGQGSNAFAGSIAIGGGSNASGLSAAAVGGSATAGSTYASSLGSYASALTFCSLALGAGSLVSHNFSAAIGPFTKTTAAQQMVFGGDDTFSNFGYTSLYFGTGVTSIFNSDRFWTITGASGTDVAGSNWYIAGAKGTGNADGGALLLQTSDRGASGSTLHSLSTKVGLNSNTLGLYLDNTRFQEDEGTDVVAANNLTLGTGNTFTITGNVTVNAITSTNWQEGAVIRLHLTGTPTLKHNTAGGAGTTKLRLAGAVDFAVTAYTVLQLELKDGFWCETGRTSETFAPGASLLFARTDALNSSGGALYFDANAENFQLDNNDAFSIYGNTFNVGDIAFTSRISMDGSESRVTAPDGITHIEVTNSQIASLAINANVTANSTWTVSGSASTLDLTEGKFSLTAIDISTLNQGGIALNNVDQRLDITASKKIFFQSGTGTIVDGRFEEDKGVAVASANNLTLGLDGNLFSITGAVQINAITTADWQAGSTIGFVFTGAPTVKHNTAGGAGTATLLLAGSADYVAAAGDYLELRYDGTNWHEVGRKLAASGSGPTVTADNGLTKNTATNVQLGGPVGSPSALLNDRYIDGGTFFIRVTGTANGLIQGINSSNGTGVYGQSASQYGVRGISNSGEGGSFQSTSNTGVNGTSDSFIGVYGQSTSSIASSFMVIPSSTNTDVEIMRLIRETSGTAANGIGGNISFWTITTADERLSNKITSKWTDATFASRTSQLDITGVTGAATQTWLSIGQSGFVKFRPMTVTEAGAIATAEGLMVFVSNTDGTFTSVGLWIYQNGAWKAL